MPQLDDWPGIAAIAKQNSRVIGAAPYVLGQAMLVAGDANRGALIRGVDPAREDTVADIGRHMRRSARRSQARRASASCSAVNWRGA